MLTKILILVFAITTAVALYPQERTVSMGVGPDGQAIALESPLFTAGPFSTTGQWKSGQATRVMLLVSGLRGDDRVFVCARDALQRVFWLPVESVNQVPETELQSIIFALDTRMDDGQATVQVVLFNTTGPTDTRSNTGTITIRNAIRNGLIICDGNSLTSGAGLDASQSYPGLLMIPGYSAINLGVPGQTTTDMLADVVTQVDTLFNPERQRNIVVAWEIGNAIVKGRSPQGALDDFITYCAGRKAMGFEVVAINLPRRPDLPEEARTFINERLSPGGPIDRVVDVAGDERLNDPNNQVYRQPDRIHFTAGANQLIADKVAAVIAP